MSPAGRVRQRLLTSQPVICRCWAALKCRGSNWMASPVSETTRPIPPKIAATSAAVVPKPRRRGVWAAPRGERPGRSGGKELAQPADERPGPSGGGEPGRSGGGEPNRSGGTGPGGSRGGEPGGAGGAFAGGAAGGRAGGAAEGRESQGAGSRNGRGTRSRGGPLVGSLRGWGGGGRTC